MLYRILSLRCVCLFVSFVLLSIGYFTGNINRIVFLMENCVTVFSVMYDLSVYVNLDKCQCYGTDVSVTARMSALPHGCQRYRTDASVTARMSVLPHGCQCYRTDVSVTAPMSVLPHECQCYRTDAKSQC